MEVSSDANVASSEIDSKPIFRLSAKLKLELKALMKGALLFGVLAALATGGVGLALNESRSFDVLMGTIVGFTFGGLSYACYRKHSRILDQLTQ